MKNKKSQSVIEFLMTYGWMVLIVLIVGTLIFSFVDFGSLLPAKVELNNNIIGDESFSVAYATDSTNEEEKGKVHITFTYNGDKRVTISSENSILKLDDGRICEGYEIINHDLDNIKVTGTNEIQFLQHHLGTLSFNCTNLSILNGEVLQGDVNFFIKSERTGVPTPIKGDLRLKVTNNDGVGVDREGVETKGDDTEHNCSEDGVLVLDGESHLFYNSTQVELTDVCHSLQRTCENGILNGSTEFSYSNCSYPTSFDFKIGTTAPNQDFKFSVDNSINFQVDFGDGTKNTYSGTTLISHEYATIGDYVIKTRGYANRISYYGGGGTPELLKDILTPVSNGITGIISTIEMFRGATQITTFTAENFFDEVST
jgi:hypothetical protein